MAEGGNLGFTQRGRIEYALGGGRINADFIDNSRGGLLGPRGEPQDPARARDGPRRPSLEDRNALLAEVEQDVVRHVLYDNFLQAQILSQETKVGRPEPYEDLMQALEPEGVLERDIESLPAPRRWPTGGGPAAA